MLVNCLNLQYSAISQFCHQQACTAGTSFTDGQTNQTWWERDLIHSAESIRLPNWFKSIIPSSTGYRIDAVAPRPL